jgi:hypothetical protein
MIKSHARGQNKIPPYKLCTMQLMIFANSEYMGYERLMYREELL